jgi:hypothetical protein
MSDEQQPQQQPTYVEDIQPSEPMPQYGYPVNPTEKLYNDLIRTETLKEDSFTGKINGDVPADYKLRHWCSFSKERKLANFTPKEREDADLHEEQMKRWRRMWTPKAERTAAFIEIEEQAKMFSEAVNSNSTNDGRRGEPLIKRITQMTQVSHNESVVNQQQQEAIAPKPRWF